MTALEEELKISRKMLRGIIFCENVTKRVEMACKFVPNLQYIEYKNLKIRNAKNLRFMCIDDEEINLIRKFRSLRRRRKNNELMQSPIFTIPNQICIEVTKDSI